VVDCGSAVDRPTTKVNPAAWETLNLRTRPNAARVEPLVGRLFGVIIVDAFSELNYRARIEALITEREGMIAENKHREQLGHSMAYPGSEFDRIVREFGQIQIELRSGR
jgi:hypothetical protein